MTWGCSKEGSGSSFANSYPGEIDMAEATPELVVVITQGADHELSSVAFTIANGGITSGLKVSIFLTSNGVDLVRKRAIDSLVVHPLEPLAALMKDFLARGGRLWACTPCVKARGYEQGDLVAGVEIAGSSKIHELIKSGAATLSF
jgi:predicted peroxiredoxin